MAYEGAYVYQVVFGQGAQEVTKEFEFSRKPTTDEFIRTILYESVKLQLVVGRVRVWQKKNPESVWDLDQQEHKLCMGDFRMPYNLPCTACPLCVYASSVKIDWRGSPQPLILIVGEAPGKEEEFHGSNFVGRAGEELRRCLQLAGISDEQVAFDNIVKCAPWTHSSTNVTERIIGDPLPQDIKVCKQYLINNIIMLNPKVIVPVGVHAANALLGGNRKISTIRGREWHVEIGEYLCNCQGQPGCPVCGGTGRLPAKRVIYPTFHPASVLHSSGRDVKRSSAMEETIVRDLRDAYRIATGEFKNLPNYKIVNNTLEAYALLQDFVTAYTMGYPPPAYDLETKNLSPFRHDSAVLGICLCRQRGFGFFIPWDHPESKVDKRLLLPIVQKLLSVVPVVGQNLKFDAVWSKKAFDVYPYHAGDTLMQSFLIHGALRAHDLKSLAFDFLGYPYYEMELQSYLDKYSKEEATYDKIPLEVLGKYGCYDAESTFRLNYEIFPAKVQELGLQQIYQLVMAASHVFSEIEFNGLAVDFDRLKVIAPVYAREMAQSYKSALLHPVAKAYLKDRWKNEFSTRVTRIAALQSKRWRHVLEEFPSVQGYCEQHDVSSLAQLVSTPKYTGGFADQNYVMLMEVGAYYAERKMEGFIDLCQQELDSYDKLVKYTGVKLADNALRDIMFRYFFFPVKKITDSTAKKSKEEQNPSLDDEVLVDYILDSLRASKAADSDAVKGYWDTRTEFLIPIRKFRKLQKLNNSYIETIPEFRMHGTDRITCGYSFTTARTGRASTRDMSLHLIPQDSDIKRLFISRWNSIGGLFLCADYSQAELRMLATVADDAELIRVLREGRDIHRYVASKIFRKPEDEISGSERRFAKTVTFGIIYGRGAKAIAAATGRTEEESQKLINEFYNGFPKIREWIDTQHRIAKLDKCCRTPMGFIRWLPGADSMDKGIVAQEMRRAQNTPIQSVASYLTLASIVGTHHTLKQHNLNSLVCGFIHDSQEADVYPGELESVLHIMRTSMEVSTPGMYPWIKVPMEADFEVGVRWGGSFGVKLFPGGTKIEEPKRVAAKSFEVDRYPTPQSLQWFVNEDGETCIEIPGYSATTGPHEFVMEGRSEYLPEFMEVLKRGYRTKFEFLRAFPSERETEIVSKRNFSIEPPGASKITFKLSLEGL